VLVIWFFDIEEKAENDLNPTSLIIVLMLGYNLLLHAPVAFINACIILKEFSMEFYQLLKPDAGSSTDDISLGFHLIAEEWNDFVADSFTLFTKPSDLKSHSKMWTDHDGTEEWTNKY